MPFHCPPLFSGKQRASRIQARTASVVAQHTTGCLLSRVGVCVQSEAWHWRMRRGGCLALVIGLCGTLSTPGPRRLVVLGDLLGSGSHRKRVWVWCRLSPQR